jgi:predicted PurR-regulated permease PerM
MKRLAWSTGVILATVSGVLLGWELRNAVVLFILSLVIAATVRPLVDWFTERRLPRTLALLFTYVVCVGFIIALVLILSGPLLTELQQLTTNITSGYESIRGQWPSGRSRSAGS